MMLPLPHRCLQDCLQGPVSYKVDRRRHSPNILGPNITFGICGIGLRLGVQWPPSA